MVPAPARPATSRLAREPARALWRHPGGRRVGALAAVALLGAASLAGCGRDAPPAVRARATGPRAGESELRGRWPAPKPKPQHPIDPATGLSISGPFGPPWPRAFTAADAIVPEVALYEKPGVPVPTGRTLPNPTVEDVPLVFLVRKRQGAWLQVQINQRPNGATAWIKTSDVHTRSVPNHVLIELGARKVTVFHGDQPIWSTAVAPGKPESPTPIGSFYVDVLAKPYSPDGPYGAYQISFTGFSTVYEHFGTGNGQVAMHGTNHPQLIGTYASHGCVRMTNPDITWLLHLAPQGTPVDVVP